MEISDGAAVLKTITYRALIASVLGVALGACSTITNAQAQLMSLGQSTSLATASRQAAGPVRRASPMTERQEAELVYKILAAEIAGRRGRVDLAAQNYSDAANATDDPRVSERAVKLALYSRDFERADGAVRRWVELEPDSVDAWQHRAQVSLRQQNVDDTTNALEQVINLSDEPPSMVIGNVVNSILRQSDSEVGARVLDQLGERFPRQRRHAIRHWSLRHVQRRA